MRLAREAVGSGSQTLVIVHGLLGQARNWRSLQKAFAGKLSDSRVIAVDLRNHGASPHSVAMRMTDLAADLSAVLSEEGGGKKSFLLGHSLGGKAAMALALTPGAEQSVGKLVVADVAPVAYAASLGGHDKLMAAMQQVRIMIRCVASFFLILIGTD